MRLKLEVWIGVERGLAGIMSASYELHDDGLLLAPNSGIEYSQVVLRH